MSHSRTIRYRKPTILDELSPERHAVIEASAGTGKTYTLKHLVVDLLLAESTGAGDGGSALDDILVVTFTRRATADLRAQIRGMIGDILRAHAGDAPEFQEAEPADPHWEIDAEAAETLREALLGFEQAEIYTIHSFCQRLLTQHAFQNGQLFELELADEAELFEECFQEVLRERYTTDPELKKWLDAWTSPPVNKSHKLLHEGLYEVYSSQGELRHMQEVDSETLLEDSNDKKALQTEALLQLSPSLERAVERKKQREGLYCYSDMLSMVADTLRRADEGDEVCRDFRRFVREQYDFALIDEFQDTDPEQWEIFRRLFVDGTEDHSLYIIGDPKQAIYRFRGADVWTYLQAKSVIEERAGGDAPRLEHNYRSTPEMVDAYNAILEQDVDPDDETFFTNDEINYANPVKPNPVATRQVRRAADQTQPPAITAMRIQQADNADEFKPRIKDWLATEIESILWGDGRLEVQSENKTESDGDEQSWTPVEADDIYVLTNSNGEAAEIGDLLRSRGIPYAFYRQDGLFERVEAQDILMLLQGIAEPGRRSRRRATFRTPFFDVPIRALPNFDAENVGDEARDRLWEWHGLAEQRQFITIFQQALESTGLLRREVLLGEGERALTNYEHLFELLTKQVGAQGQDLAGLIGWLQRKIDGESNKRDEEADDIQRLETDRPAVQIMTMHKSKGLEAEVVFVYGGFWDSSSGICTFIDHDDPAHPEAERITSVSTAKGYLGADSKPRFEAQKRWDSERLMYVAMTRAKSRLYLCYSSTEGNYGRDHRHKPLVRALDRLDTNNPLPDQIDFTDIGAPGSHPETSTPERVAPETWQNAPDLLADFEKAVQSTDDDDHEQKTPRSWEAIRKSTRESVSFSGVREYSGSIEITLREGDDEAAEASGDGAPEDAAAWEELIRDDRFDADQAVFGRGREPGNFLHDVLEEIEDYSRVLGYDDARAWLESDDAGVGEVFETVKNRHDLDDASSPDAYAARLLFDTLRTPVDLPAGGTLEPLAVIDDEQHERANEVPFRMPIPEGASSQSNGDDGISRDPKVDRGWIEGSIDLVFRHDGRVYIVDWKSNARRDYAPRELAPYVDQKYSLQAKLYTLATVQMLGLQNADDYEESFGGCGYFFVRGMRPEQEHAGEGILWCRPTWRQVQGWKASLGRSDTETWKTPSPIFTEYFETTSQTNATSETARVT